MNLKNWMNPSRWLLLYAAAATLAAASALRRNRSLGRELRRVEANCEAFSSEVTRYRTACDREAASAQVLRLRCDEYRRLRAADAAQIEQLGIRLRRAEAAARSATRTELCVRAPLTEPLLDDTIARRLFRDTAPAPLPDPTAGGTGLRSFRWSDAWTTVEGVVAHDSVHCRIRSVDTLRQVVHRIPRRFLFIRWGTKALRQEITASNPHTQIVYTEYVKIER